MHKSIPLRTGLGIERDLVIVGHFACDRLIVYDLVFEAKSPKWGVPELLKRPIKLERSAMPDLLRSCKSNIWRQIVECYYNAGLSQPSPLSEEIYMLLTAKMIWRLGFVPNAPAGSFPSLRVNG